MSPTYPNTYGAVEPPWGYWRSVTCCTETPGYSDWWLSRYSTVTVGAVCMIGTGS